MFFASSTWQADVSAHLAVRPVANLHFEVGKGAYDRALTAKGYTPAVACASDCTQLSRAAVSDGYCNAEQGLASGFDAVLSVIKPPGVTGVAGTGSACASDQLGRPLWIVVAWHHSIVGYGAKSAAALAAEHLAFFRHEALHGLGFTNSFFNYARDAAGKRKGLTELRPVIDRDGARDEVWHFVKGRAYELGRLYFACDGNATATDRAKRKWDGVPLMGLPEMGRGAHWETRIMRDDVMSYGTHDSVSSITLAAMEDLGFYLANYSHAGCMRWGRGQGCEFVRSRCGSGSHDRSTALSSASSSKCRGDDQWVAHPDPYLVAKCEYGNDPCSTAGGSGYLASGNLPAGGTGPVCDAQCSSDPSPPVVDATCTAKPSTQPEGAFADVAEKLYEELNAVQWQAWLIPCIWLLALLVVGTCIRKTFCPRSRRCRLIAFVLCWLTLLCALAGLGGTTYIFIEFATFKAFVGGQSMLVAVIVSGTHALFAIAMIVALCVHSPCLLNSGFWFLFLLVLVEVLCTLLIVYWIYSLGSVPADALNALFGTGTGQTVGGVIGQMLSQPVALAEGIVCKTYQTCCRDVKLALIQVASNATNDVVGGSHGESGSGDLGSGAVNYGTGVPPLTNTTTHCLAPAQHDGASTDLEITLRDPSTKNFCAYTSGAPPELLAAPPFGTCLVLEQLAANDGFSLPQCKAQFCQTGVDGYIDFLELTVRLIQRYAVPVACGLSLLLLLQLIFACNLRNASFLDRKLKSVKQVKESYAAHDMPVDINHL